MNFEYYWPQFSNGKRQAGRIDQEKKSICLLSAEKNILALKKGTTLQGESGQNSLINWDK